VCQVILLATRDAQETRVHARVLVGFKGNLIILSPNLHSDLGSEYNLPIAFSL